MIVQDSRIQLKYTSITGIVPTIPLTDDHTDGTWLPTDLYIGEVFLNAADNLAWWRSENGLVPFGATGASGPFIGDFVSASMGGTYSGPVYGPQFNADLIVGDEIQGITGTFTGPVTATTFYGDGSNLTGLSASWNGGVVPNPSEFQDDVIFDTNINVDIINSIGPELDINTTTINVGGTGNFVGPVIATTFYGDGSNLTGITGTTDTYTEDAYLDGNVLKFDRNDLVNAYSVDLSGLVSSPIDSLSWNPATNELNITFMDSSIITVPIGPFTDLDVVGSVTADFFVGDGSLLTNLPGGGGAGPQGPQGPQGDRSIMNLSYTSSGLTLGTGTKTLPITTPIVNLGWQQGTRVRIWNDATHYMEGQITSTITNPQTTNIDVNVDYVVGTGTFGAWYVGIAGDLGSGGGGTPGATGATGNPGSNSLIYKYGGLSDGDISADGSMSGASQFFINVTSLAGYTTTPQTTGNAIGWLGGIDINDKIQVYSVSDPATYVIYNVDSVLDVGAYAVTAITSNGNWTTSALYTVSFNKSGVQGPAGPQGATGPQGPTGVASQNLQETLQIGNTSGNNNISFNNYYGLVNSSGEGFVKFQSTLTELGSKKFSNATDYKRGYFLADSNNGIASMIGDTWNQTGDLYQASYCDLTNYYARMATQETQISTGNGYLTLVQTEKNYIRVGSAYNTSTPNSNFLGLIYDHDYSAMYTNRSLVDKEYVDNAVAGGGGGSQTLAQTLALGNSAGTYDINMNNNDITNVATVSANGGPAVQMINMTNAVNMMLMYNS